MILQIERQWPISKLSGSFGFYLSNQNRLKCFGTCLERPEMADFSWSLWSLLFDDFEGIVRTSPFVRFGSYSKPTNLNQLSTSWWKRDPKIKGLSWPTQPGAFPKVTAEKSLGGWMFFSEWPNIYHFGQPPRHPPAPPPPPQKHTANAPQWLFGSQDTHNFRMGPVCADGSTVHEPGLLRCVEIFPLVLSSFFSQENCGEGVVEFPRYFSVGNGFALGST